MTKRAGTAPALALPVRPGGATPLHRQVYDGVRTLILSGGLAAGCRLPASRVLAAELGVSRNTVLNAFEQLLAEGYVEGRVGAGTFVARSLPDERPPRPAAAASAAPAEPPRRRELSTRGRLIATTPVTAGPVNSPPRAFRPGVPAFDEFPFALWEKLAARRLRRPPAELLGYADPRGYRPLREAIAAHLAAARGVRCAADQIVILAGSQQGLDLTARLLLDPGDSVWIEDPGYLGARGALLAAGAQLVPVPVDAEGLRVADGAALAPAARLAYVTPSHQYPLGVTMTLARRLALLQWASAAGAWVLEDDYDSEFRYVGRPLAALQGLDADGRVIYLGTFSKVLYPGLRLGYFVAPPDLVDAFEAARALVDRGPPGLEQAVLADFVADGHFVRHLRRTRALYAERRAALLDALRVRLAGRLDPGAADSGMHVVGCLPAGSDDVAVAARTASAGVETPPVRLYRLREGGPPAVMLGYAAVSPADIRAAVERVERALADDKG